MISTYLGYHLIARDMPTSLQRVQVQPMVERETKYYLENIGKVKSIDDFVGNDRLFRYAMKAHGLADMAYAKAFMVKVLKEGVTDPDSFANKLTDKRYAEFARAYDFDRYGELATSYNRAQHDAPKNFLTQIQLGATQPGFDFIGNEVGYYLTNIGKVTSIDDLLADTRLLDVALGAFGFDPDDETPARVREMLEGGVTDPDSPANSLDDKRYANFVAAFNFVERGAATTNHASVRELVPQQFVERTGVAMTIKIRPEHIAAEARYYAANIGKVTTIEGLLADKRLLTVAMAAYGLDADKEEPRRIRQMLYGGVSSPTSPANSLIDKRYASFVTAFNFAEHGAETTSRSVVTQGTLELYTVKSELGVLRPSASYVAAETNHYLAKVVTLRSIDDLLADRRLLDFALSAYGLDPTSEPPSRIRQMLEGGIDDPKSPANKLVDKRYAGFVSAFNFAEFGEEATVRSPALQPVTGKYLRQTLEEDAGRTNEGVRLALYFERKASEINSAYSILADPALSKVVYTALGLPSSFANADIDKQAKLIETRLDMADFKDPKLTADFLKRFTTLWELENPSAPVQSAAAMLFSQPVEFGVSPNLLLSIQQLKF